MGAIGIYGDTCFNLKSVLKHLGLNENEVNYLLRKLCNTCIQATYFIFCKRTRHGITLPCYHGKFDTLSLPNLWGLTQSPHSPQLALSTAIVLSLGSPHATVQGAMPVSSVSGPELDF